MHITIPCDTLVRLASVIDADAPEPFTFIRVDNGQLVASNKRIMSIDNIMPRFDGLAYIYPDPALVAQCAKEAPYNSTVSLTVTEPLRHAMAKTSMGYVSGNLWRDGEPSNFDRWRAVALRAATEGQSSNRGGMFWNVKEIERLMGAAPSGKVVFSENINTDAPTLLRDPNDFDWCGVFSPEPNRKAGDPQAFSASLPDWLR